MGAFLHVLKADFRSPTPYLIWGVLTLLLAIAGPFGSYLALGFPQRLLYWGGAMVVGMVLGLTVRAFVHSVLGMTDFRRGSVLIAAVNAALLCWPLREMALWMFPQQAVFSASLPDTALLIFSVSLTIGAFRHSADRGPLHLLMPYDPAPPDLEAQADLPRIVRRLDPALQGRLIAMTVRDHYVDVSTLAGRGSVLMRFADAIDEAEGEAGDRIHRSHWVAWWAVKGVERDGGKTYVRLCPELRLPVSRTYREVLERRGLVSDAPGLSENPLAAE